MSHNAVKNCIAVTVTKTIILRSFATNFAKAWRAKTNINIYVRWRAEVRAPDSNIGLT